MGRFQPLGLSYSIYVSSPPPPTITFEELVTELYLFFVAKSESGEVCVKCKISSIDAKE